METLSNLLAAPMICVGWCIMGVIAGSVARLLTGSTDRSFISDLILGILGAIVGGLLAALVGLGPSPNASGLEQIVVNLLISTVGACVIILFGRSFAVGEE
jgi:uncharacterized membrane protein YeaQ/YmgE (transglycosylase-associated protein family)